MTQDQLYNLFIAFRDGQISDDDLRRLKDFLNETRDEKLMEMMQSFSSMTSSETLSEISANDMYARIIQGINQPKVSVLQRRKNKIRHITAGLVAALLLIFIKLSFFPSTQKQNTPSTTHQIVAGRAKGNLLLDNGEVINLEKLTVDTSITLNGYTLTKDKNGEISYTLTAHARSQSIYNTIVTPKGGEYVLSLPDGTRIWINADSKLRYPLHFSSSKRELELEGEALFMVSKVKEGDQDIPFIVKTGKQTLEVLGTTFNINSYSNQVYTTLVEGAVKLRYEGIEDKILQPNQQASYSPQSNNLSVKEVDPYYTIAWKTGVFAFDAMSIQSVMEILGRWYDFEIEYYRNISNLKFTGTISKYEQIDKVLSILEMTGDVKFKINERRVIVM